MRNGNKDIQVMAHAGDAIHPDPVSPEQATMFSVYETTTADCTWLADFYRPHDALSFARFLVSLNPGYTLNTTQFDRVMAQGEPR